MAKSSKADTPATIIRRANRILKERGWTKGVLQDYEGKVCAVGALRVAAFETTSLIGIRHDDPNYAAYRTAYNAINRCSPTNDIPYFNDVRATSSKDIQKLFNCGIKKLTSSD